MLRGVTKHWKTPARVKTELLLVMIQAIWQFWWVIQAIMCGPSQVSASHARPATDLGLYQAAATYWYSNTVLPPAGYRAQLYQPWASERMGSDQTDSHLQCIRIPFTSLNDSSFSFIQTELMDGPDTNDKWKPRDHLHQIRILNTSFWWEVVQYTITRPRRYF